MLLKIGNAMIQSARQTSSPQIQPANTNDSKQAFAFVVINPWTIGGAIAALQAAAPYVIAAGVTAAGLFTAKQISNARQANQTKFDATLNQAIIAKNPEAATRIAQHLNNGGTVKDLSPADQHVFHAATQEATKAVVTSTSGAIVHVKSRCDQRIQHFERWGNQLNLNESSRSNLLSQMLATKNSGLCTPDEKKTLEQMLQNLFGIGRF
jgi:hypothetical protein